MQLREQRQRRVQQRRVRRAGTEAQQLRLRRGSRVQAKRSHGGADDDVEMVGPEALELDLLDELEPLGLDQFDGLEPLWY